MKTARSVGSIVVLLVLTACAAGGGALSSVIVDPRLQERLVANADRPLALGTLLGPYAGSDFGSRLTSADQRLATDVALASLSTATNGEVSTWRNPNTGHAGSFTPVITYSSEDGLTCRDYNLEVSIDGNSQGERGAACLTQEGTWWTVVLPIRSSTRRGLRR